MPAGRLGRLPGRTLLEFGYVGDRVARQSVGYQLDPTPRRYLSTSPFRGDAAINYLNATVKNPFYGSSAFTGTGLAGATVARSQLLKAYPEFSSVSSNYSNGFSW